MAENPDAPDRRSAVYTNWEKGANNVASVDRLPVGYARNIVNADPLSGGRLDLRTGYEKVYAGTAVRGVLALKNKLLIADGTSLVEFDTNTNSSRVLRAIVGSGVFVGDDINDTLYFCTANECLRYDGLNVYPWGVADVNNQPSMGLIAGGLEQGSYQMAMTYTDPTGLEGGTDAPAVIAVPANGGLSVTVPSIPAGHKANIYVGSVNGATLYLQAVLDAPGTVSLTVLRDDTARCNTMLMQAPIPGTQVATIRGVVAVAVDNVLQLTAPMQPHLVKRKTGFIQFSSAIGVLLEATHLFVSAERCYVFTNVETDSVKQDVVLQYPAVPGTGVRLPDGRGAWMTQYGQAITRGTEVDLINRESFAPMNAASGAAGVVDHNGNQLVVTTLKGINRPNLLAASDFFEGEILNP